MRRSQDGKLNKTGGGGDAFLKEKKKALEQAYGVSPILAKSKAVNASKSSGALANNSVNSKLNLGLSQPTSRSSLAKRGGTATESPLVAASRARYAAQKKAEAAQKTSSLPLTVPKKAVKPVVTAVKGKSEVFKPSQTPRQMKAAPQVIRKPPSPVEDNYDDDDFEEDYPSDFEEVESTDSEDLGHNDEYLAQRAAAAALAREQLHQSTNGDGDNETKEKVPEVPTALKASEPEPQEEEDEESSSEETEDEEEQVVEPPVVQKQVTLTYKPSSPQSEVKPETTSSKPFSGGREMIKENNTTVAIKKHGYDFEKSSKTIERKSRGKKLMEMIHFDKVYWDLLHLRPNYEQFMLSVYGSKRVQQGVQTDKDVLEAGVQTEVVEESVKWTQKPPTWSTAELNCDIRILRQEALGVGTDVIDDLTDTPKSEGIEVIKDWPLLSQFINRASKKILYVLESQKRINLSQTDGKSIPEMKMNRGLSVLSKLEMNCLSCDGDFVACSNGHAEKDKKKHTSKNIITVWSLKEPSNPMYFLRAWGQVTVLKIYTLGHIAFAGFKDGTLSAWDLDEATQYHSHYQEQLIRTPSVTTSCMESGHTETITGLGVSSNGDSTSLLLTVDLTGLFLIWVCRKVKATITDEIYSQFSSAWGHVYLSLRQTIKINSLLNSPVLISGFSAWRNDDSFVEFILTTGNGFALKGMLTEGDKMVMKKYQPKGSIKASITTFDISWDLNLLLTGCMDCQLRMYDIKKEKLVLTLTCESVPVSARWSKNRSSLFYIAMNTSIDMWDLLVGDIRPWKTIKMTNLQGFELYCTPHHKEFQVILQSNELKITSLIKDMKSLSTQDQNRIHSYISLLLS